MPPTPYLVDSSFLYTLYNRRDKYHEEALAFTELVNSRLLILDIILVEVTYLFQRAGQAHALGGFLAAFHQAQMPLEPITYIDIDRARELILTYASSNFDFVDACLMAYAERNSIQRICTYDYRDFGIVRPRHCDSFILLPAQIDRLPE
jgi:uncharacterized protein